MADVVWLPGQRARVRWTITNSEAVNAGNPAGLVDPDPAPMGHILDPQGVKIDVAPTHVSLGVYDVFADLNYPGDYSLRLDSPSGPGQGSGEVTIHVERSPF